jgi:hypothetical protein
VAISPVDKCSRLVVFLGFGRQEPNLIRRRDVPSLEAYPTSSARGVQYAFLRSSSLFSLVSRQNCGSVAET